MKSVTIEKMLGVLAKNHASTASKRLCKMLSYPFTTPQCLVLCIAAKDGMIPAEFRWTKDNLAKNKFIYSMPCPNNTRTAKNKIRTLYKLTSKGEQFYNEIIEKFTPLVEDVNEKLLGRKITAAER